MNTTPAVDDFPQTIRRYIEREMPSLRDGSVLVAVSGGADSVALLLTLHHLKDVLNLRLVVAHYNHNLRGEASRADSAFVTALGAQLNLPVVVAVEPRPVPRSQSDLRGRRYDFLTQAAQEHDCNMIALGQHLDDQAETVLLRMLRGAGVAGLGAMRPLARRGALWLARPLLCVRRHAIEAYLRARGQDWREDAGNQKPHYARNYLRLEIMPRLVERFGPHIAERMAVAARLAADDDALLHTQAQDALQRMAREREAVLEIDLTALLEQPRAMQRRVLRLAVERLSRPSRRAWRGHAARVERILDGLAHGRAQTDWRMDGVLLRKRYRVLLLGVLPPQPEAFDMQLPPEGTARLPDGGRLIVTPLEPPFADPRALPANQIMLDPAGLHGPLCVRSRRPGDSLPLPNLGRRAVRRLMMDANLPREARAGLPLVYDDEGILWVAGLRRAARAYVAHETTTACLLTYLSPETRE